MTDPREKTEQPDIKGEPVAWRFPFDTYHMAHTSDPAEAAKYRDAEPLFTADEPGLWRFWNEKAQKLAGDKLRMQADHDEAIASLRQELAEAREVIAFYADKTFWNDGGFEEVPSETEGLRSIECVMSTIMQDAGRMARRALAAGKEG